MSFLTELRRRNVFRVAAAYGAGSWLLIQVTETVFPAFGLGPQAVRLIIVILTIGFLPALLIAWVFEWTPDGLRKERDLDRDRVVDHRAGRTLDRVIIGVLSLAVVIFALDRFVLSPAREETIAQQAREDAWSESLAEIRGEHSIAVLPFADLSPAKDQEYLSDGLAEELLNLLAQVPELRVISRTSAFSYKGRNVTLRRIADELDVAHILEGSVRKSGDRVRVTAQLIEAQSDTHLFSQTYDRTLDDVFGIQDEIAADVVEKLRITLLGPAPTAPRTDPAAYELFLKARQLRREQTAEGLGEAEALLKASLDLAPDYVPAWTELAGVYSNQVWADLVDYEEGIALSEGAARQALRLDPTSAAAHTRLGFAALRQGELAEAAGHYEQALRLAEGDVAVVASAADMLRALGRVDEAVALHAYQVDRDPLDPITHYNLAVDLVLARRYPAAEEAIGRTLALSPEFLGAHYILGLSRLFDGDGSGALEAFAAEVDEAWKEKGRALALFDLGAEAEADAALAEFKRRWGEQWDMEVVQIYAYRGDLDEAFEWLDGADSNQNTAEEFLNPLYDRLRNDPRWTAMLERLNVTEADLQAIPFEVSLPGMSAR